MNETYQETAGPIRQGGDKEQTRDAYFGQQNIHQLNALKEFHLQKLMRIQKAIDALKEIE